MRAVLLLACIAAVGCVQPAPAELDDPVAVADPDNELMSYLQQVSTFPEMRIETDFGMIRIILYDGWTPQTAGHVGGLAADGFYDGLLIHRVVDDFVIQSGDPTGTGEGGSGPGGLSTETVPLEIHEGLQFGSGAVGLARWTDDTGDSQWFITEKPALHLNDPQGTTGDVFGAYSLFGQVFEGMDVVRAIAAVETLPNDRPVDDVHVVKAELLEPPHIDWIGLVPTVHAESEVLDSYVEVPRWSVAGHPFRMTYSVASGGCDVYAPGGELQGLYNVTIPWQETADACTWVAELVLPAGAWHAALIPGGLTIDVLPWHDAYGPFTGATGNHTNAP